MKKSDSPSETDSNNDIRSPAPESPHSTGRRSTRSRSVSRSRSPRSRSRSESQRSRSGTHSRSRSPPHSRSGSPRSRTGTSIHSQSGSPHRQRSQSASPHRHSQNGSPNRNSQVGSPHSMKSTSPQRSPAISHRSRSPSYESRKSNSNSRSRSGSEANNIESRSVSRTPSDDERNGSPISNRKSRSRSIHSRRSHSGSVRSRSGSNRSQSGDSKKSQRRSRSKSQLSQNSSRISRSRSRSRLTRESRSRSKSQASNRAENRKRKVMLSDDDDGGARDIDKNQFKKIRLGIIDSDTDESIVNDKVNKPDVNADALFGDADDISSDEELDKKSTKSDDHERESGDERRHSDRDREDDDDDDDDDDKNNDRRRDSDRRSTDRSDDERSRRDFDDTEKEVQPEVEPIPDRRIDVQIPRIVTDVGKEIHFVKLPNFLSVDTRPFEPDTYEDAIDDEDDLDEEGRQRIKLKVSNTIRWRDFTNDNGETVKESNTRIIKWSDGSMSLHLGNEVFDVYKQPLQGDHNHLFIRQGTGLQGQAVFRTKLTFRPHSTESFTHKKMTMSLADRSQKTSGIKILTNVGHDPDADRMFNLKKEEEKLRQAIRQKTSQTKPKRSREATAIHNTSYREEGDHESDDEGVISIAAIKNKYKKGAPVISNQKPGAAIYSSDEEDSDFETRRNKKSEKRVSKALRDSDDSNSVSAHSGSEVDEDGIINDIILEDEEE